MYAELAVIIIVFAIAVTGYLKGKFITSVLMFMASLIAAFTTFGFFEIASKLIIGYGFLGQWVYTAVFLLIFVITFLIVNISFDKLLSAEIYFNDLIDRIGRTIFGILTGLVVSGVLLTAVAMAPIPSQWPYERFTADSEAGKIEQNKTLILNADGFISKIFSIVSAGSMGSKTSFAAVHPDFIDEIHLNRQNPSEEDIAIIAGSNAIKIKAAWTPDVDLKSSSSENPIPQITGEPVIVRVGFNAKEIKEGGGLDSNGKVKFVLSQLKLLCKSKDQSDNLYGKATAVYPIGFISSVNTVEVKKPSAFITINRSGFAGGVKIIDFVFYIPKSTTPILMQFKQGAITSIPKLTGQDKAPDSTRFIQASDCSTTFANIEPQKSTLLYGTVLSTGEHLIDACPLALKAVNEFKDVAQNATDIETKINNGSISYTRAKIVYDDYRRIGRNRGIPHFLDVSNKQKMIGLKCNNPKVGNNISSTKFPCLKDFNSNIYKPVGVIAKGEAGEKIVFEVDYNSSTNKSEAFPKEIWLTEQADKISELHFLYLIDSQKQTIITEVLPSADSVKGAAFKGTSGLLIE